jgi:hypothetical protein
MVNLMRILPVLLLIAALPGTVRADDPYTVVAHYYTWYGGERNPHWPNGVAHRPWIGYYNSGNSDVARQQIDLAARYGVDVFGVEWSGIEAPGHLNFRSGFLKAPNLDRIRFCIVYDTFVRFFRERSTPLYFNFNDPVIREAFVSDLVYLARQYFGHKSYFKLEGRPVVQFYLARAFSGEFPSALQEARARIRELGWDPYFVGDSLFFGKNDLYIISQFDAATSYSIYPDQPGRSAIQSTGDLADAARPFYWNFLSQLSDLLVPGRRKAVDVQPGVLPQFDARVARRTPVALLAKDRSEVVKMFRVAREIVDAKASGSNVVWITSWNEWHEGTSIEPTVTGGKKYPGGNYGYDFLEAVAEVFNR